MVQASNNPLMTEEVTTWLDIRKSVLIHENPVVPLFMRGVCHHQLHQRLFKTQ
jgi:hypothetical protein